MNKSFKFLILLKEIIMIIKNYNKIALNVTQIIDRHIQMHSQDFFIFLYKLKFSLTK